MSRPRKMHKPLKGNFTDIINAIADGKGVKKTAKDKDLWKLHTLTPKSAPSKKH